MNKKYVHGHPRFYELVEEIKDLHERKNKDYATKDNPLGNFYRRAKIEVEHNLTTKHLAPVKIALSDALKQWDAALKLVGTGEKATVEGIPQRLKDIAVYSLIAIVLYEEITGET